jgi:hypothetical protein
MATNRARTGAATPPRRPYDRAATTRRLRALTIATFVTSAGATAYLATLAGLSTGGAAAVSAATAAFTSGTSSAGAGQVATAAGGFQATSGSLSTGTARGQVVTGGSHR